jgi:hypothetical protein
MNRQGFPCGRPRGYYPLAKRKPWRMDSYLDDDLTPLDYLLVPAPGEPIPIVAPHSLRLPRSTTVYVWGHEPPQSLLCREQCQPSAAAALFAARHGWNGATEGAWAKEITLGVGLIEALRAIEPVFRRDPAALGWGMRTVWRC